MAMSQLTAVDLCVRCYTPAPGPTSAEFLEWDPIGDGEAVICPRCLTEAEEAAL